MLNDSKKFTSTVVLAMYNGERYIKEQLESILKQTLKPDEVLILDDCSSDNGCKIVDDFIKTNNLLETWKLIKNEKNQGWKKNFKLGFDLAHGDYIFPCDQDDIWYLDKIEKMCSFMEEHNELDLIATNFDVLYEGEGNRNYSKLVKVMKKMKIGSYTKIPFNKHWMIDQRMGCTFCFRKCFYDSIKKYWNSEWSHDGNLWRFACIRNSLAIYALNTEQFRRHGDNATATDQTTAEDRFLRCKEYIEVVKEYKNYIKENNLLSKKTAKLLENQVAFYSIRGEFLAEGKIIDVLKLFFVYRSYYFTFRSFLGDIYYSWFAK